MYTLVKIIALSAQYGERYKEVPVNNWSIYKWLENYKKVYLVLTHSTIIETLTLDLKDIPSHIVNSHLDKDIPQTLAAIGNTTLPHKVGEPEIVEHHALYSDAFIAGYHVDTIDYNVGQGVQLADEEKPHLILTDELFRDIDYVKMRSNVLASVNDFYHYTAANQNGFYIVKGNDNKRKSQRNKVGLYSFHNLGGFDLFPIKPNMLSFHKKEDGTVYRVSIKYSNNKNHENRFPILILGGYLNTVCVSKSTLTNHPFDDPLVYTGNNTLSLKLHRYPLIERYYESIDYLDFTGFDVNHDVNNFYHINKNDLYSESFLKGYFTMSNSFIVLLKNTQVLMEKDWIVKDKIPHTFLSWKNPKYPIITCEGKHSVYWKNEDDGCWLVRCTDTYRGNMTINTTSINDLIGIDDAWWMGNAGDYSPGYMLKMYKEDVKILA